jgi:hypothetical protein
VIPGKWQADTGSGAARLKVQFQTIEAETAPDVLFL